MGEAEEEGIRGRRRGGNQESNGVEEGSSNELLQVQGRERHGTVVEAHDRVGGGVYLPRCKEEEETPDHIVCQEGGGR